MKMTKPRVLIGEPIVSKSCDVKTVSEIALKRTKMFRSYLISSKSSPTKPWITNIKYMFDDRKFGDRNRPAHFFVP
jgi:hypothetical protein